MTMKIRELKLFVLLLGFLGGNLFGTILVNLREFLVWDGLIILTLIILSEAASYMSYKPSTNFRSITQEFTNLRYARFWWLCKSKICKNFYREAKFTVPCKKHSFITRNHNYWQSLINFFKIGAMIGFFVDAFKVGS